MRKAATVGATQPGKWAVGKLCYTDTMVDSRAYWSNWAHKLHGLGVSGLAAALLDGTGSLRLLAAQMVYAGTPFIGTSRASEQWQALATMLEDSDEAQQFVSFLREEDHA